MAKVGQKTIRFLQSDSPDVVTNKMYVEASVSPSNLTYDSTSFDVGNTADPDGYVYVNLGDYLAGYDGIFDIGIAAVDDTGNEADMSTAFNVPLDFQAPNPVGPLELL